MAEVQRVNTTRLENGDNNNKNAGTTWIPVSFYMRPSAMAIELNAIAGAIFLHQYRRTVMHFLFALCVIVVVLFFFCLFALHNVPQNTKAVAVIKTTDFW